jgi:hypothetical protein
MFWQAFIVISALIVINAIGLSSAQAASNCPFTQGALADAKPNKLYLYFPPADDTAFPNVDPPNPPVPRPTSSSPLHQFNVTELPAYRGTATELRDAIQEVVTNIYCDFNVQVLQTDTPPPTAVPRRNTVGIGTDDNVPLTSPPCNDRYWLGQSQTVGGDVGDAIPVDYARVWAGTFQTCAGRPPRGQLSGSLSTVERWADAIGSTAAHEAAHNYGLSHDDGLPIRDTEDEWFRHLMRDGQGTYTWKHRADRRHFSDHEYSLLAANVCLAMDTMWSWDFINPNGGSTPNAKSLKIELLSAKPSLILSWSYAGPLSPWINPVLTGPTGTRELKGITYNVYQIEWSSGQSWSGGPSGELPNGANFHIGATFSSAGQGDPTAIIMTDVKLFDAGNTALPLHPRWIGFDAATLDATTGRLQLQLINLDDRRLILRDVVVRHLPRMMSIDAMTAGKPMLDLDQRPFLPWPKSTRRALIRRSIQAGDAITVNVANTSKQPYVVRQVAASCPPGARAGQANCEPARTVVDLFPATTMYVTARVVDPDGQRWDPGTGRFVAGAVESRLYYQITGRRLPLETRLRRR